MIDIVQFEPTEKDGQFAKEIGIDKLYNLSSLKKLKIINGGDDNTNRRAVEGGCDILLNPHNTRTKDFMHFRNSGLNHILCNLAAENKVIIGFTFDKMYDSKDLGRVMQSIRLCRKAGCKIAVFSFAKTRLELRSVNDIISFLTVVGFDSKQVKDVLGFRIE